MLSRILLFACLSLYPCLSFALAEDVPNELGQFQLKKVFLPKKFDTNDNAQAVIHYELPDSCHKVGPAKLKKGTNSIRITPYVYKKSKGFCIPMIVNYTQTIDLGLLNEGSYKVVVSDSRGGETAAGTIAIAAAKTSEPDDYLYAPVDQAYVESDPSGPSKRNLVLTGTFPSSCFSVDTVKLDHNSLDIIDVLPIAKKNEANCVPGTIPFQKKVDISYYLKLNDDAVLFYTRALGGKSFTSVVGRRHFDPQ